MRTWFVCGAVTLGALGCTLVLEPDRVQCETNLDCERRGGPFAGNACVDGYCRPTEDGGCAEDEDCDAGEACVERSCRVRGSECASSDDCDIGKTCVAGRCEGEAAPGWACLVDPLEVELEDPVLMTFPVISVLDFGAPVPGIDARVCATLDPDCTQEREQVTSNAEGLFEVELPAAFTGYLEIVEEGYDPGLFFFPAPRWSGMTIPGVLVTPIEVGQALISQLGVSAAPRHGNAVVTVLDCLGTPSAGVHVAASAADEETTPYYVATDAPISGPAVTAGDVGVAGFANLQVGSTVLTLSLDRTGQELGQITMLVREGMMSQTVFVPFAAPNE